MQKISCPHCQQQLEVDHELVGVDVRCPRCERVFLAEAQKSGPAPAPTTDPERASADAEPVRQPSESVWYLKTPEGEHYGPVARPELDSWVREGRVSHDCVLAEHSANTETPQDWQPASVTFPMLIDANTPFAPRPTSVIVNQRLPHRGGIILSSALLGCLVPPFSLFAAIVGTSDIRMMQRGKMDPSGEGLTRAGQIIAVVSTIVWISGFGILLLVLLSRAMA